jgi:UDP-3-O-[3-hydroxymyristoyl] glucosamine N-acyltransferase
MNLPKELSLAEIAALIGGKTEGDAQVKVKSVALSPLTAKEGDIALFFDPKYIAEITKCKASAVLIPDSVKTDIPAITVKRPLLALQKMLAAIAPKRYMPEVGIHPSAIVDATCELGKDVAIGANVVIGPKTKIGDRTKIMANVTIGGEVEIGLDCLFHPGCMIADYIKIGNRVIMQQGASIGADGFSYVTERPSNMELRIAGIKELSDEPNPLLKISNIGTVIIEDDVEVGSNATIDRATMGATIIGKGTKIDNLVMIAHNVRVGREALIVSQTGIAGSSVIGDRAVLAGQVGIKDHINVGKDAILEGKAAVMKDIADQEVMCGVPAQPARDFFNQVAHVRKLPKMLTDFRALQKKVDSLEKALNEKQLVR